MLHKKRSSGKRIDSLQRHKPSMAKDPDKMVSKSEKGDNIVGIRAIIIITTKSIYVKGIVTYEFGIKRGSPHIIITFLGVINRNLSDI